MDEQNQKHSNTAGFVFLITFLIILFCIAFFALHIFCDAFWPNRFRIPSPNGEYALEQRYIDMRGAGYRGKTYLLANGRYYFIDSVGPGYAGWESDTVFYVYDGTYSVFDFIPGSQTESQQEGAVSNAGP